MRKERRGKATTMSAKTIRGVAAGMFPEKETERGRKGCWHASK